jgi:hypothetical protein
MLGLDKEKKTVSNWNIKYEIVKKSNTQLPEAAGLI